jgi:hypothetical protein
LIISQRLNGHDSKMFAKSQNKSLQSALPFVMKGVKSLKTRPYLRIAREGVLQKSKFQKCPMTCVNEPRVSFLSSWHISVFCECTFSGMNESSAIPCLPSKSCFWFSTKIIIPDSPLTKFYLHIYFPTSSFRCTVHIIVPHIFMFFLRSIYTCSSREPIERVYQWTN